VADPTPTLTLLAETVRIRLLSLLEREELGVGELVRILGLPQSTVSRHLKALQVAGWVHRRADGSNGWYRFAEPDPEDLALWEVVRRSWDATPPAAGDRERLRAAVAAREAEGSLFFERLGEQWDAVRRGLFGDHYLLPTLLALLPPDWVIADLGCGTGAVSEALAPLVRRVIAVDREPSMVDAARRRLSPWPNVEVRQGGLERLPLAEGEVDAALCVLVLHHVAQTHLALAEVARTLRPGGRLVILDLLPHDRHVWRSTMGHQHLGFAQADLERAAEGASLKLDNFAPLPEDPEATAPPLFVSTWARPA
jgi:ArsR family transcriptional regulator